MRKLDYPPLWLLVCVFVAWSFQGPLPEIFWPGVSLLIVAAWITIASLAAFRRARTTIIPHQKPAALITDGIYRFSRNPIYLADVMILLGVSLIWGSALGLMLTPALALVLDKRFIKPEEARLEAAFGAAFDEYRARVRKWI
ncbi:MAG: isoprenylcysteine carboxylmethyltransferase family protein [Silicimonas sp.]|nr:isoprenylcysteine carboxylmethyltransferase family protein [Silicimonas sp.]